MSKIFILSLFFFSFSFTLSSQDQFKKVAAHSKSVNKFQNIKDLSLKLTSKFSAESDKVKSIFYWITEYIIYDVNEYHADSAHSYYNIIKYKQEDVSRNDSLYNLRILDTVIRKQAAICDGYARLFKTLCSYSGIKAEMIVGMGKTNIDDIEKYDSNHAWNSVQIDKKWYLLDACWGSGSCDDSVFKFTKKRDEFYFLTEPKSFSYTHFPDDKKHLYYSNAFTKQQFINLPLVYPDFFYAGFDSFTPTFGIIDVKKTGKIQITVSRSDPKINNDFSGSLPVSVKRNEIKHFIESESITTEEKSFTLNYKYKAIIKYKIKAQ